MDNFHPNHEQTISNYLEHGGNVSIANINDNILTLFFKLNFNRFSSSHLTDKHT